MLLEEVQVLTHSGQLREDPGAGKRGAAGYQVLISWWPELGPVVRMWTSVVPSVRWWPVVRRWPVM